MSESQLTTLCAAIFIGNGEKPEEAAEKARNLVRAMALATMHSSDDSVREFAEDDFARARTETVTTKKTYFDAEQEIQ